MDFEVIYLNENNEVSIRTGEAPRKLYGVQKLAQIVTVMLLRTIGRDVFNIPSGGNIQTFIGRNIGDESELKLQLVLAVNKTREEIMEEQSKSDYIYKDDETLANLTPTRVEVDSKNTSIYLGVRLLSAAGESRVIRLPLRKV
jgi:hypothetical protein